MPRIILAMPPGAGAARGARVGVGFAGGNVQGALGRLGSQFPPARPRPAGLHGVRRVGRIAGQCIGLGQVIDRRAVQHVAARRLVAQAQFVLRAFGRFERVARAIHADGRRKRLAGAEVRRQAVVGQVHQAHAAGRGAVAKTRRGAVGVVLLVGVRPILAAAQHQHPFVLDLDLSAAVVSTGTAPYPGW
ncbi:hypothetical protein G6F24_016183 [Rhizopus arrhizus]|nr:hypothetical protein G6F24_016183 [Rhizopus arrhizus]